MSDTGTSEEDIEVDVLEPYTFESSHFTDDNSLRNKKYQLTNVQSFETNSPPNKKYKLIGEQSSGNNCSFFPFGAHSPESGYPSQDNKHHSTDCQAAESDFQSRESNCQSPKNNSQISESNYQSTEKHWFAPRKKDEYFNTQPLESGCSFPDDKITSVDSQLCESSSSKREECISTIAQPLENCSSSFLAGSQNFVSFLSQKAVDSSSTSSEYYKNYTPTSESDFSSPNKEYHLATTSSQRSSNYPLHEKHKLNDNEFSNSSSSAKHISPGKLGTDDLSFSSTESISAEPLDISWFAPSLRNNSDESPYVWLKSSIECEKMLRQIIRTAYQFTRHSHREKLTLKDLEKAFKIHNVDIESSDFGHLIDKIEGRLPEGKVEPQTFTCTGKWLRKQEDLNFND